MSNQQHWQRKWREVLGESTDSMPDIREDYALHFDIWKLDDEKLEACFSIFPNGKRILKRVNEVRKVCPQSTDTDDETLLSKLNQLNENIEIVLQAFGDQALIELNSEKSSTEKCCVYRGSETLRCEVFKNADPPTIHLDDALSEIIKKHCGGEGYEALCFLSEPLYQLAGCDYTVSHWIAWAMVENEYDTDPYYEAFELYKMKAEAGWSDEEQFVYINSSVFSEDEPVMAKSILP